MRIFDYVRRFLFTALLVALPGCSEFVDPDIRAAPESELTFVRLSSDSPAIDTTTVTFWAVRGKDREVQIRYFYAESGDFAKCLRLLVPAQALHLRPDGTPFAVGDSVRITVRMPDPTRLTFEFDPAGLRFDPLHPATIEVVYRYADRDFNGDGVVDRRDDALAANFGFWKQERPGEVWTSVSTQRFENIMEARATVTGFTKYALASE